VKRAATAAAVVLAMLVACAAGYVARSPLRPGESLVALVDSESKLLARCRDVEALCDEFRSLPSYQALARSPQGRARLDALPFARVSRAIRDRSRVFGYPAVDVFDLLGGEVVVAGTAGDRGPALLAASRVRPAANLLLGVYLSLRASGRLPAPAGHWPAGIQSGLLWTKVGDVLAVSNDADLLARFVASARSGRRRRPPLARHLTDDAPQLVLRLRDARDPPDANASAIVLSLRLGAGAEEALRQPAAFAMDVLPADTGAGLVCRLNPVAAWNLVLGAQAEREREHTIRYAEDKLCALFDAEEFEADVLGRLTGDCAVVAAVRKDALLTLAAGRPMPTVSLVVGVRSDAAFEKRLPVAFIETFGSIIRGAEGISTAVTQQRHRGVAIAAIQASRPGERSGVGAGYFVVPNASRPGTSLIVASTSVGWLRSAIDVREGKARALRSEKWFEGVPKPRESRAMLLGFAPGDLLADTFTRAADEDEGQPAAALLLRLLGAVTLDGSVGADSVLRGTLRITGSESVERSRPPAARPTSPPAAATPRASRAE